MSKRFFDYENGDFCHSMSDNMAMDSDGNLLIRMGDNTVMDLVSGNIHLASSWSDESEDN